MLFKHFMGYSGPLNGSFMLNVKIVQGYAQTLTQDFFNQF